MSLRRSKLSAAILALLYLFLLQISSAAAITPLAKQTVPLEQTPDTLNWNIPVNIGSYGAQRSVKLVFDTGSSEISLFSWGKCNNPVYPSSSCYQWVPQVSANFTRLSGMQSAAFYVDNEQLVDVSVSLGTDLIELPGMLMPPSLRQMEAKLALDSVNMQMQNVQPALHSFAQSGGIFGIGYEGIAGLSCNGARPAICTNIQQIMLRQFDNGSIGADQWVLGLNFDPYGASWADIAGVNQVYQSALVWGEFGSTYKRYFHGSQIYHPKICGVDLFYGYSSSWSVEFDTESSCLGLPLEMFNILTKQVNATCVNGTAVDGRQSRTCYVDPNQTDFPILTFSLEETEETVLYIAIEDLLLPSSFNTDLGRRLCVVEKFAMNLASVPSMYKRIIFGAKVLGSLYTALDYNHTRVGFAQGIRARSSSASLTNSHLQCATPLNASSCALGEELDTYMNACVPKKCSNFYLFEVNPSTGDCRMSPAYSWVIVFIIACLTAGELIFNYLSSKEIRGVLSLGNNINHVEHVSQQQQQQHDD